MKKLIFLLLAMVAMFACKKEEEAKPDYSQFKAIFKPYTPKGTLKAAFTNSDIYTNGCTLYFGNYITTAKKDTVKKVIYLPAYYIISDEGELKQTFMGSRDFYITDLHFQVMAIIPDSTMERAQRLITNAHKAGKIDSCLWYLQNEYKYIPVEPGTYRRPK